MEYLVTPSLYSAWQWYMRSEQTKEDFLKVLNKVRDEPTEAMLAGIQFENDVVQLAESGGSCDWESDSDYTRCVAQFADQLKGSLWQHAVKKKMTISWIGNILLYGKADAILKDTIYDLKFTKNYDEGKFRESIQHLTYMSCSPGIEKFVYLVSNGSNNWEEAYYFEADSERILRQKIYEMLSNIFLDPELKQAYITNWKTREDNHAG